MKMLCKSLSCLIIGQDKLTAWSDSFEDVDEKFGGQCKFSECAFVFSKI